MCVKVCGGGHLQDPGDVAGSGAAVSELHDLLPGGVRQRPAVHEHAPELVHAAVTCVETRAAGHGGERVGWSTGCHGMMGRMAGRKGVKWRREMVIAADLI